MSKIKKLGILYEFYNESTFNERCPSRKTL